MSDRLDVVLLDDQGARIFHQQWGASALVDLLLAGPEGAWNAAQDGFPETDEITDVIAACVIDRPRKTLVVAGPIEGIRGQLQVQEHTLLDLLESTWGGWNLAYEPEYVVEPVVLYAESVGVRLASLNTPHALADALGKPRFELITYKQLAPVAKPRVGVDADADLRARPLATLFEDLSFRAANDLQNSNLVTVGEVLDLDATGLARANISLRTLKELREVLGL
ncbi:MAG: hypothetical protein SFX73_38700 [Kofleriaceae bacterium]|nr:hypothetical protein [Kofleriaceae bacterium]